MKLQRGVNSERVLQGAQYRLFVEGNNDQEIDPNVIQELLNENELTEIKVEVMGACDNVRSASQALIKHHPLYYFLIDRDDQELVKVEDSWRKFPDPDQYNMIIWRKRELENYFIDPAYIQKSSFLKPSANIRQRILKECRRRIFLDAANLTLHFLSRTLRQPLAIEHFKQPEDFKNENAGLTQLEQLSKLTDKKTQVINILEQNSVKTIYCDFVIELTGGVQPLQYGSGTWLERMSGKEVFRVIANECFEVRDASNNILRGKEQNKQIAKQLVKGLLADQPADFQELVQILKRRVGKI